MNFSNLVRMVDQGVDLLLRYVGVHLCLVLKIESGFAFSTKLTGHFDLDAFFFCLLESVHRRRRQQADPETIERELRGELTQVGFRIEALIVPGHLGVEDPSARAKSAVSRSVAAIP